MPALWKDCHVADHIYIKGPRVHAAHLYKSRVERIYGHETGGSGKWSPEVVYSSVKITQPFDFFPFLFVLVETAKPGFTTKTLWSRVFLSPQMLKQFILLGENKHYCTLSGICLVSEHVPFAAQPPLRDTPPPSSTSRLFIVAAVWVLVSALWSFLFSLLSLRHGPWILI